MTKKTREKLMSLDRRKRDNKITPGKIWRLAATLALFTCLCLFAPVAHGQGPVRTPIADTLYTPGGTLASGRILVSAPSTFTAADGTVVPNTTLITVTVTNGVLSVSLVPNANSTPVGTYYKAQYILTNGTFTENWIIPLSGTPINLLAIRTAAPPTPAIVLPMSQVGAPVNCSALGGAPFWNGGIWTCSSSFASLSMNLESPVVGDSGVFQWKPKHPVTLTRISCSTDAGSVSVNLDVRTESAPNVPGTSVLSAPLSCTPTTGITTTFAQAVLPAETPVALDIASSSGANVVRIHVEF
jgi:hypothetical protein